MKTIWTFVTLLLLSATLIAQSGTRYQTYQSVMTIMASKNGMVDQWKNDRLSVVLDYKTGEFLLKLTNTDFANNRTGKKETGLDRYEYKLQGIFPIREIIDQQQISRNYVVELELVNFELQLNQTLKFDLNVTNPGTNQKEYRIFMLQGYLYNNEVNLPAFEGYDNEVELHIAFNGYIVR